MSSTHLSYYSINGMSATLEEYNRMTERVWAGETSYCASVATAFDNVRCYSMTVRFRSDETRRPTDEALDAFLEVYFSNQEAWKLAGRPKSDVREFFRPALTAALSRFVETTGAVVR